MSAALAEELSRFAEIGFSAPQRVWLAAPILLLGWLAMKAWKAFAKEPEPTA